MGEVFDRKLKLIDEDSMSFMIWWSNINKHEIMKTYGFKYISILVVETLNLFEENFFFNLLLALKNWDNTFQAYKITLKVIHTLK